MQQNRPNKACRADPQSVRAKGALCGRHRHWSNTNSRNDEPPCLLSVRCPRILSPRGQTPKRGATHFRLYWFKIGAAVWTECAGHLRPLECATRCAMSQRAHDRLVVEESHFRC